LRRVRSRARVDLDLLSRCSCTVCTKKGILHLPVAPEDSELLRGKNSLTSVWQRAWPNTHPAGIAECTRFMSRVTGGSPVQTNCRRRARRRCRIERGSHTKDNTGPRFRME
jgi:hypothetical protein